MRRNSIIRLVGALAAIGVALAVALVLVGTADDEPTTRTPNSAGTSEFPYPVFWLGDEYGGYKPTRVIPPDPEGWQEPTFFVYGGCAESLIVDCDPAFVVKTSPNCDPEVRSDVVLRGRETRVDGALAAIETGSGSVYVYARDSNVLDAVDALQPREQSSGTSGASGTNADLPGSDCAFFRVRPRTFPTAASPEPFTPEPQAATVFSALESPGGVEGVQTYDEAMATLGWRPVRTYSWRYTLAHAANRIGALRTLANPLPLLEQRFHTVGQANPIHMRQEPESYSLSARDGRVKEQIGPWAGESWSANGDSWFAFFSGEEVDGQRIRVVVWGPDFRPEVLRQFVSTLTFD